MKRTHLISTVFLTAEKSVNCRKQHCLRSSPQPREQHPVHGQHRRQRVHGGAPRPRHPPLRGAAALFQHTLPAVAAAARLSRGRSLRPAGLGQHGQLSRRGRRRYTRRDRRGV